MYGMYTVQPRSSGMEEEPILLKLMANFIFQVQCKYHAEINKLTCTMSPVFIVEKQPQFLINK